MIRPIGRGANILNIPEKLFNLVYFNTLKNIKTKDFNKYFYNKIFNSCWGDKICLKYDGNLFPCAMSSIKVGKYKNIIKILTKKNSYRYLTKDKIKYCKKCEMRYLCAECRAMYSSNRLNISKKPYTCTYNPKTLKYEEQK